MLPGWLADTVMANSALSILNKANGGKIWNPYLKVAKPAAQSSSAKTSPPVPVLPQRKFSLWAVATVEAVLILGFAVSLIPTSNVWNRITNPAAHHISNESYYSTNISNIGGIWFYALSTILLFMAATLGGLIIKNIYQNDILNLVLKISSWILGFVVIVGLMFMPIKHISNLLNQESYDNWIKKEVGVSEIIYLKNGFIQGKDGIYKVDQKKENGYYKYTVKKVEL